jgi:hypothetical protein
MAVLPVGFGASGGYTIDRSLRLRSSASAYLSRTPASAGNRKTWTYSIWFKYAGVSTQQMLGGAGTSGNEIYIQFLSTGELQLRQLNSSTQTMLLQTSQVFRDPSAWYHMVIEVDTTQATSSDRIKIYINGSQVTAFSTASYYSLNYDSHINNNVAHYFGRRPSSGSLYFDGYLTEINFVDGQALDATSFGEYNEDTGVWQPIKYAGTYGTNGFYLNFSDNTSTTTLGYDTSGNGNNWTANNISVTSGVTYDSMTDVPTLTSTDAANYAVLNPLDKSTQATVSDGNLKIRVAVTGANHFSKSTMTLPADKIYFEAAAGNNTGGTLVAELGLVDVTTQTYAGVKNGVQCVNGDLLKIVNGSYTSLGGGGVTSGTVIGLAYDLISGLMTIYRNGTAVASNQSIPTTYTSVLAHAYRDVANDVGWELNFGQRPFAYTPPTGFKSLNTYNLPDSTIEDGSEYFNTVLWTGDGSARTITGVGFDPDFVWIKDRSTAYSHVLFDRLRGAGNYLISNGTLAELTDTNYMSAFVTDGFSVGTSAVTNGNTEAYVAWNWKANGSGVSNTDGSTTSTVSANTTAGFSIVTYTGTGSAATVGHGLGVAPGMIIVKERTSTSGWFVYTSTTGAGNYLSLSGTGASAGSTTIWNNTAPTSSVFSVGANNGSNENTQDYVAYCFAEVEGFSKFGSYTGTGSSTAGPFVYLGFRPAFVMIKRTDSTGSSWYMQDTTRNTFNALDNLLFANVSNAEGTWSGSALEGMDALSNGFKWRNGYLDSNANGGTYIYMAFAENPFKNSLAR